MAVQFVGIDPATDEDGCPTVWVDTGEGDLLVQSYGADEASTAQCDALSPAKAPIPATETIIRIPKRMVPIIRKACDALDPGVQ